MFRKLVKGCRREEGQALVELAFVLPLVLLFLFGIIDFGLALNQYNGDTNIANLAARQASVMAGSTVTTAMCGTVTETSLSAWVTCEAAATGAPTPSYVCAADEASSPSASYKQGDPLKVTVQSSFNWLSILTGSDGYVGKVVNPNSTLSSSATMRVEGSSTTATTNAFLSSPTTTTCTN